MVLNVRICYSISLRPRDSTSEQDWLRYLQKIEVFTTFDMNLDTFQTYERSWLGLDVFDTNKCCLDTQNHFGWFGTLGRSSDLQITAKNPFCAKLQNLKFKLQAVYLNHASSVGHHEWFHVCAYVVGLIWDTGTAYLSRNDWDILENVQKTRIHLKIMPENEVLQKLSNLLLVFCVFDHIYSKIIIERSSETKSWTLVTKVR
jgi:hypothetical protein